MLVCSTPIPNYVSSCFGISDRVVDKKAVLGIRDTLVLLVHLRVCILNCILVYLTLVD